MNRSNSEVICLQSDVAVFRRVGFAPSASKAGAGSVRLVHNDPNRAFDALLKVIAKKSTPFVARIGRTAEWSVRRMAFAGNHLVILGSRAPQSDEVRQHRLVRGAFRRLALRSEVR